MARPSVLQDNFARMIQDAPPDQLPPDAAWEIVDFLPTLGLGPADGGLGRGGRLAKRGGWRYAAEDAATDLTSAVSITGLGYLLAQDRLCLGTDNNKFGYFTPPGSSNANITLVSTSSIQSTQRTYVDAFGTLIIPNNNGTTTPKSYDGTTFGNLGGSPPAGQYAALWNDRLILGGVAATPRRTFFSAVGTATTWDTTNSWVDVNRPITGYAVLPTSLLVFGSDQTARIRGKVPPPGSPDMAVDDPIFNIGCTYVNSIAVNNGLCVFANEEGVFLTNGTSQPQDLTAICGVKNLWQVANADRQALGAGIGKNVADAYGGFIGNYYLIALRASAGTLNHEAFLFNLVTQTCVILDNWEPQSVVMTPQVGDELFFGIGTRVVATSPIFTASSDNKQDANGSGPSPSITTRFYGDDRSHDKRMKTLYVDYAMTDAASDNPTLAVTYYPNWQGTTDSASLGTLSETTAAQGTVRAKLPIRKTARGGMFKIQQTNASASTVISALLLDAQAKEGGRV